jgi:hypothetical protein
MFFMCPNLTAVPEDPPPGGLGLGSDVFNSMFLDCTSLVDASAFKLPPATGQNCFERLFKGCTALTAAPVIPDLSGSSYPNQLMEMFYGCSNLAQINVKLESWPTGTSNWLAGVSANGTFYCPEELGTNSTIARGDSKCPTGWNVVNESVTYLQYVDSNYSAMMLGPVGDFSLSCRIQGDSGGGILGGIVVDDSTGTFVRYFN